MGVSWEGVPAGKPRNSSPSAWGAARIVIKRNGLICLPETVFAARVRAATMTPRQDCFYGDNVRFTASAFSGVRDETSRPIGGRAEGGSTRNRRKTVGSI